MRNAVLRGLFFAGLLCVVASGVFVVRMSAQRGGPPNAVAVVDLEGKRMDVGMLPAGVFAPRISPDGKQIAYDVGGTIWIAPLSNPSAARKLTSGTDQFPLWTPDGQRVVFTSARDGGVQALYWLRADGIGDAEQLAKPARSPESWSAPGQLLSYITLKPPHDYDIWTYSAKDKKSAALIETPGSAQFSSRFSHDGRWVAYESDETGATNVWVQPYPLNGKKYQITTTGGSRPLWSLDDGKVFFDHNNQMFAVTIQTKPAFKASEPMPLPIQGFVQGPLRRQYDIMPDGKSFLMMFRAG